MAYILEGFGEFLPYIFILCVCGLIWNFVFNIFNGGGF